MFKASRLSNEYSNLTEAREKIMPPNLFGDVVIEIFSIWERVYWVKSYVAYWNIAY